MYLVSEGASNYSNEFNCIRFTQFIFFLSVYIDDCYILSSFSTRIVSGLKYNLLGGHFNNNKKL